MYGLIEEKYMPIVTIVAILLACSIAVTALVVNAADAGAPTQLEYTEKLFDTNRVMQINIQIDQEQWDDLLENAIEEKFVPCDITVNGTTLKTVGIRAKGNSSLSQVANDDTTDRFSFKLNFSKYVDGQNLDGLHALALNNMISDPTYMKEYLSYDMMAQMGVNTPAYSFANITVNGEEWGLYLAVELLKDDFLTRYYGTNYGNLYKPESSQMGAGQKGRGGIPNRPNMPQGGMPDQKGNWNPPAGDLSSAPDMPANNQQNERLENGGMPQMGMPNMGGKNNSGTNLVYTDDQLSSYQGIFDDIITKSTDKADQKTVVKMIKNLNNGTNLEQYLDVDEILRYFAVNTFLVNLDSYAGGLKHNYYLYEQDGKFQILPWDFNLSFGSFQMNDAGKVINFPIDAPVTDSMENSPLISKLLEVEEYKERYHNYLSELLDTYISSGKFDSEITRLDSLISEYVKKDATAFYTFDEYQNSLTELRTFGADRSKSITAQLAGQQPAASYGNMETTFNLSAFGSMRGGNGKPGDMQANKADLPAMGNQNQPIQKTNMRPPNDFRDDNSAHLVSEGIKMLVYLLIALAGTLFTTP